MSLRYAAPTLLLLAACGGAPPDAAVAEAPGTEVVEDATAIDWSACRLPASALPVGGRLFVVDGGRPAPGAEPGREAIRRVDIEVPGPVSLLLTAPDMTVWMVRVSPETEVQAVFASGDESQRITGQRLGDARLAVSAATGQPCGRYWRRDGDGPGYAEVAEAVFGRGHDAVYTMRTGTVVIGGTDSMEPDP
ncbi:hypothetical protein [Arenimonas composti]|uniref:Uncharacterized protein n=1 Tax=Arenimonas composti TR7-09 = DSM 18010 TaxID=1121013 RepID=A0A091BC67_9GAMM|nr:hypothetical protein [Arenimonas composti]KFN50268.1 hypothetical protein P873_07880 [Arenimonas composti TR7-09 = DSM 18010]